MSGCPQCGTALEGGARFCGVCGHRLADAAPASGPPRDPTRPSELFAAPEGGDDPYLGQVLSNRFQIETKLGEGGFGAVYQGVQLGTHRKVALKLLHPEMTRDANVLARFRREGQVLCSLRDAHTVTTYDFDQTPDGTLFIAMELLEGRSLHDVFREEAPIDWRRMLKIVAEMCSSLHEAHEMGIVHRDLKPENVHLEDRPGNPEFVKILDFGIAKVVRGDSLGAGSAQLTATGQTLGTLEYMSPEQLMGKELDGRSDVYGLGVLAYELMTGRLPFPDAVGPAALISAQLREVPEPPSAAHPAGGIPPEVDALVLRMLAKERGKRFAGVAELQGACEAILAQHVGGPSRAVRTPLPGAVPAPQAAEMPRAASLPPDAPTTAMAAPRGDGPSTRAMLAAARSRTWLWLLLLAVLAAGGVVAFLVLR